MELVFTTPGTYINVKDGLFSISLENEKKNISPAKVERLILTTEAVLTTAVVKLCADNNIDLVILDWNGDPVGRFWHSRFGSIPSIRRNQLDLTRNQEGIEYAKQWIIAKLTNELEFIKDLAKNRSDKHDLIIEKANTIETNIKKLEKLDGNIEEKRNIVIGLEGSATRVYFEIR